MSESLIEAVLRIAKHEMEVGAGEEGENNSGPFVKKYLNGLAEPPANWCAAFVSWCFRQAARDTGKKMPFRYTLGARDLMNQLPEESIIKVLPPIPGDLIFFWRGDPNGWMGHVGIVSMIGQKSFWTIEGNRGVFPSKVNTYQYWMDRMPAEFLGFGRINV